MRNVTENAQSFRRVVVVVTVLGNGDVAKLSRDVLAQAQRVFASAGFPVFRNDVVPVRRERTQNAFFGKLFVNETAPVTIRALTGGRERATNLRFVLWVPHDAA